MHLNPFSQMQDKTLVNDHGLTVSDFAFDLRRGDNLVSRHYLLVVVKERLAQRQKLPSRTTHLQVGSTHIRAAARLIAAFHASWATLDPHWGDLPSARLLQLGSGAFVKGAESLYVTCAVAHARDVRVCGCHQLGDELKPERRMPRRRRNLAHHGTAAKSIYFSSTTTLTLSPDGLAGRPFSCTPAGQWGDGGVLLRLLLSRIPLNHQLAAKPIQGFRNEDTSLQIHR
jgi:hypothetical protein